MKYAYFIKADPTANNNKYYEMKEDPNGRTFTATWGRIDHTRTEKEYPMSKWNSVYNRRLKRGYKDVTEYHAEPTTSAIENNDIVHAAPEVVTIFRELKTSTTKSFEENYTATSVTKTMIDDSQDALNQLAHSMIQHHWLNFNNTLIELFHIIPRRMTGKVVDYTLPISSPDEKFLYNEAQKFLTKEQDLLDMVRAKYKTVNTISPGDTGDFFAELGIAVAPIDRDEKDVILKKLGANAHQFVSAIRVAHAESLNSFIEIGKRIPENLRLEWHGSRTENWLGILSSGLVLYPTSAVITGKMFGYGLYFAPKARKSMGYTSLENSYWARGSKRYGYLGLFHINLGRQKDVYNNYGNSSLNAEKLAREGYHSVYAHAGRSLYNDEIIVYQEPQSTIGYLVKIKG